MTEDSEMNHMYRIAIYGLLMLLLIVPAMALTENFQNFDSSTWGGGFYPAFNQPFFGSIVASPYTDTFANRIDVPVAYPNWATNAPLSTGPVNYMAVSLIWSATGGAIHFVAFDSTGAFIAEVSGNGTLGRYEIKRVNSVLEVYCNGVYERNIACAAQPYTISYGCRNYPAYTTSAIFDDYVSSSAVTDVVGLPPHTWFVGKDLVDPSTKGLFNNLYNNVYTDHFYYTISNATNTTVHTYSMPDPPTSGRITITSGAASDYIDCKSVTLSGTSIYWDKNGTTYYAIGDTGTMTYVITSQYWDSALYDYKIKVLKFNTTGGTYSTVQTTPILTSSGTATYTTTESGTFGAELIASPKSAPNTDYMLAIDYMLVVDGVKVSGYTYDGILGVAIGSVSVQVTQAGTTTTSTSNGAGLYVDNRTYNIGQLMQFTASKSGYQNSYFNYTFTGSGTYQVDFTLMPTMYSVPTDPEVTHSATAIAGVVTDNAASTSISGASVGLSNGTWNSITTSSATGIFLFDNLLPNSQYTINCSKSGYASAQGMVSSGSQGSITYYNFKMNPALASATGTTIAGYTVNIATESVISGASVNLSNSTAYSVNTTPTSGLFAFGNLDTGAAYHLNGTKSGYAGATGDVTTGGGGTITYYNLFLTPVGLANSSYGAALAGYVIDSSTLSGLTGATVTISNSTFSTSTTSSTPYGSYIVDNLSESMDYLITANKSGYTSQSKYATTNGSASIVFTNLYLSPGNGTSYNGTAIYGLVLSTPFNAALSGVEVSCPGKTNVTTDVGGFFKFESLQPNTAYNISVHKSGFGSNHQLVTTGAVNSGTSATIYLAETFNVEVRVKDIITNSLISNATVLVDGTNETATVGGVITLPLQYDVYSISATAGGYYESSQDVTVASNKIVTLYLTPLSTSSSSTVMMSSSTQRHVKFSIIDTYGAFIPNCTVTVTPIATSIGQPSWWESILGVPLSYNITNVTQNATTDYLGSCTFLMFPEVQYNINVVNTTLGINQAVMVYPHDDYYVIRVTPTSQITVAPLNTIINYTFTNTTHNATFENLSFTYYDSSGMTTNVSFWVKSHQSPLTYCCQTYCSTPNNCQATYTCAANNGQDYVYGFTAISTTYGNITASQAKTFNKLLDLGIPAVYYPWIAACFLIILGGMFSVISVRFAAVIIPAIAYLFWLVKWIDLGTPSAVILGVLFIMGVISYIRKQEDRIGS